MASKQGSKQPLSALEKKMMECSNLFEQSRGSSFAKPRLSASGATKHTYASGFNMPRPPQQQQQPAHAPLVPSPGRLPVWCQRGDVPSVYRDVERQVTGPAGINGALVCSLLLSSGLSRPALGRIWDLCSRTVPGSFTQPELYATLALVAIAQAGHPPELELLSRLPQPPVPMFAQPVNNVSTAPATSLPQAWPNQMSPSPSPPALQQPSATCCPTFQAPASLFPSSTSSRPLQAAPPVSSISAVTFVSSAAKPVPVVCASPVPAATLVSSAPATFVSSAPAAPFVSSVPAMTFASSVPAPTAAPPASSLLTPAAIPKLGEAVPSNPSVLPVTSSRPSVSFLSVATPAVPKGSPAPPGCGLVGASGECGGALGNGGLFASSVLSSVMNHGFPVPATLPSGSGDFDDEFDDFKSAPEQSHPQQPLATDSASSQVKPFPLDSLSRVPTNQPPLIEPTFAHDPRKANSLPDSPKLGPSKIAAVNAHNFQLCQQRNNICESPKLPKTFNFGLKIDLNSLMSSSKPPVSKAVPVTNNVSMPEQPAAVDDDFADFQTAFPEASKPSVPAEDRYSVFKELCDDGLSLWSVTDAPTSDSKDANMSADVVDAGGHTTETWHNPLPELDDKADEEDFGDFCHVQVVPPPAPVTPDKRANMFGGLLYNLGPFSSQSNDTISLGDGLSVNSLEFGAREGSLSSRHGSVLSLDFRLGNSDDDESASARTGCSDDARVVATADSQEEASEAATSSDTTSDTQPEGTASVAEQPVLLLDKYSVIRGINQDAPVGEAACIDSWTRCLESVRELITEAESVFNREASSQICREALDTEEGTSYIHNLAEVFKVCQRIALSSRLTGLQSENLDKLCSEVQATWEQLASYLENSCLFTVKVPPAEDAKWLPSADESAKSCGVCLLHVDNPEIASSKLSYSGREYHSPCANLWVNCVNSLLPAVTPVQLL
uniref:Putative vesicle coat complex copii subunit sfb3 n=1 Tax=Amblyomma aureolatum TaxID=187763 RepID=A0A1E1X9D7_9ACAR